MGSDWMTVLESAAKGGFHRGEPMAGHCSFKIGGPADLFFVPASESDLTAAIKVLETEKIPRLVIGGGSNLLVGDLGVRGAVIKLGKAYDYIKVIEKKDGKVIVEAGADVPLAKLRTWCSRKGFTGAEFMFGIPGTVGGAVMCNAGTKIGEMKDVVFEIGVLQQGGGTGWIASGEAGFSYRRCGLPEGIVVTRIRMKFENVGDEASADRTAELSEHRKRTQPAGHPSAGSVFKNPSGDFAGRLIEAAGLKGLRLGGAEVSEVHANFIINRGGATATDVKRLMDLIQAEVERKYKVRLEPEIRLTGEFR